jgi:phytanoyl-CoA hydroxylase
LFALQTKFTTGDNDHVGDDYFLTSGDKIRYFLEKDATDGQGNLTREKHKTVNKIGHGIYLSFFLSLACSFFPFLVLSLGIYTIGLHELDPVFRRATLQNEKLRSLVRDLRFHHDPVGMYCPRTPPLILIPKPLLLLRDYELLPMLTEKTLLVISFTQPCSRW